MRKGHIKNLKQEKKRARDRGSLSDIPVDNLSVDDSRVNLGGQDVLDRYGHYILRQNCEVGELADLKGAENMVSKRRIGSIDCHACDIMAQ